MTGTPWISSRMPRGLIPKVGLLNEKGQRVLLHVFGEAFPGQKVAFRFLRQQGLTFSGTSYDRALLELLDRYDVEKLGLIVAEQVKSRLHPDDLNDLWRHYWAEELPACMLSDRQTLMCIVPGLMSMTVDSKRLVTLCPLLFPIPRRPASSH